MAKPGLSEHKNVNKMMSEQEALNRLTALCSQAEHCSYEMADKMRKWEVEEPAQARVMEYLIREKYVDDNRYARCFAMDKIRYNKWGRRKVEQALWMKHIDRNIMREVLDDIDEDEYIQVLRPLLKAKLKSIQAKNDYERNMKLLRFAMGRGFSFEQVKKAVDMDIDEEDI